MAEYKGYHFSGTQYSCDNCSKKDLKDRDVYFTNFRVDINHYREHHFCSNACYFNFRNNYTLEECDEKGKVYRTEIEKESIQWDYIEEIDDEIDPTEEVNPKRNPTKKGTKTDEVNKTILTLKEPNVKDFKKERQKMVKLMMKSISDSKPKYKTFK